MIAIHNKRLLAVIDIHQSIIETHIAIVSSKLNDWLNKPDVGTGEKSRKLSKREIVYLQLLKCSLPFLVKANTTEIQQFKKQFDRIIPESYRKDKANKFVRFKDALIFKMGYSLLRTGNKQRDAFYPYFYADLKIKTCVYCNAQLAVSVEQHADEDKKSAKFQLDHFLGKAEYPCFSISFFNLYPSCGSCNLKKGENPINFELYSGDSAKLEKSDFAFKIDKASLANYRVNPIDRDLKITFEGKEATNFKAAFDIQGVYDTQKDLAAEIIQKSLIYNKSYKEVLKKSFSKLYGNKNSIQFNRLIIGSYTDPKDIHKRPMSKFKQDISRQLGLIE